VSVVSQPKRPRAKRKKMPKHPLEMRGYRYPMDVPQAQSKTLFEVLDRCWELRNILAADRQEDRRLNRELRKAELPVHYLTCSEQYVRVSALLKADPKYALIHSQVAQDVADRIDEGTKRWLESLKVKGERKVSPPGWIERKDYSSFTFPQCGSAIGIRDGRVRLSKLGSFKLIQFRKFRGTPKAITISFDEGRWWCIVTCAIQGSVLYRSEADTQHLEDTGGDPGLSALLTLADGRSFDPPKALKDALAELRHEQRVLSRKFEHREALYEAEAARRKAADLPAQVPLREIPYSNRLRAQLKVVAKLHTKVSRGREYHHRKLACILDDSYRRVAVEEHSLAFMLQNRRLARAASDRAIAAMKHWLASKLGPSRYVPTANRRPGIGGNSQTCLCGAQVPKTLKDREHVCPECGLLGPRDVVSANIVMQIAFGRNLLRKVEEVVNSTKSAAGQVVVRRGGTKGRKLSLTAESKTTSAAEVSVIRQPQTSLKPSHTRGGEPTREAKSARISGKPLLLADAQSLVGASAPMGSPVL